MIWVVAGGVAIVIVATAVVVAMRSRKQEPKTEAGSPEEPDPIFILGIIFVGSGVALFVTLGPIMFFMPVLGFIYMALGYANMRKTH